MFGRLQPPVKNPPGGRRSHDPAANSDPLHPDADAL